jgi:hypothetical protein
MMTRQFMNDGHLTNHKNAPEASFLACVESKKL